MAECCDNLTWVFVSDASSAHGCEFTIGSCASCGARLIHMFYTAVNRETYEVVTEQLVSQITALQGKEQKEFMRAWYRQLEDGRSSHG